MTIVHAQTKTEERRLQMKHVDRQMFAAIYEAQFKRVYNYISYRINNHMDTEDLVSQVFSKVIEKYDGFDAKRAALSTWIISIARNTVSDYFREKQKNALVELDLMEPYLSSGGIPEDILIKSEQNKALIKALDTLTNRERNLIALKYGAELNNKEIAQVMELTESNVGVIIFRSLQKLRVHFEKEESVCKRIAPKTGRMC